MGEGLDVKKGLIPGHNRGFQFFGTIPSCNAKIALVDAP